MWIKGFSKLITRAMGVRQRKTRVWKEEGVKEEEKAERSNGKSMNYNSLRNVIENFPNI